MKNATKSTTTKILHRPDLTDVRSNNLKSGYRLSDLKNQFFMKPKQYVEDMVIEGLTILAGRPKKGKSWLSLAMLMDVARGRETFGMLKTEQCNAIYFDLEGSPRRLKERALVLLKDGGGWPDGLIVCHELSRIGEGCEEEIEKSVRKHDAKLVVIDTLAPIRPPAAKGADPYQHDYKLMSDLQKLAHRLHIAIVVVYHTRKATSDDPFDGILGSTGTTAAADSLFVFKSDNSGIELHGSSRDLEAVSWALELQGARFVITGDARERRKSKQRREVIQLLKKSGKAMTNKEIKAAMKREVNKLLFDMEKDGDVVSAGYGLYALPSSIEGGK